MKKAHYFPIASSLKLLAILFSVHGTFAQVPKLFLKFAEKQNKIQSGYVKLQEYRVGIKNDTTTSMQEAFFITSPKDIQFLVYHKTPYHANTYCKSAHTVVSIYIWKDTDDSSQFMNRIENAKNQDDFLYPTANGISLNGWNTHLFQRIPPKMNKKNIRYKVIYPNQDIISNISKEWEFDRRTFYLIQNEFLAFYAKTLPMYYKIDILEQHLYDYIHPDILDTISFMFEKVRQRYDGKIAEKQAKEDSVFKAAFSDSIVRSFTKEGKWIEDVQQEVQKNTLFYMPAWKFPSLGGDTLYSDSIHARFLLIDMWYIACPPCMQAMRELSFIDTIYDKSLLKILSINVSDTDTDRISKVVRNLNLQRDIACAFSRDNVVEMSKKMGESRQGYPQLYLVEMKTKQVIWHSYGYYAGFTKNIEEMIKEYE